jgi:hypothetical protein
MSEAKYIIIEIDGSPSPIVFPNHIVHADMARTARGLGKFGKVSGAGFCLVDDNGYNCFGESTSLNVKSNYSLDSNILNKALGYTGV